MTELNGSSYYRSNPYYQQGGLPDTAFKNRKVPSYLVQIPQGQEHFEPTNKKHFQRIGYYSTIGDQHIMDPEPNVASPSRAKYFFRNLNVEDIQGANTNTLISQAVKNKMKAKEYLQEKERMKRDEQVREKMRKYEQRQDEKKRLEAISKINRATEPNYHEQVMKLRTEQTEQIYSPVQMKQETSSPRYEPTQQERQPMQFRQQSQAYNQYMREKPSLDQYHNLQYQNYRRELQKTQRQIKQLENQLKESREAGRGRQQNNYHSLSTHQERPTNNYHIQAKQVMKSQESERNILPETYQQQEFNRKGSVPLQEPHKYQQQYSVRDPPNYRESYPIRINEQKQKKDLGSYGGYKNYSGQLQAPQKIRSNTDNKSYHPSSQDHESLAQRDIESPIYEQRSQPRQIREQHRRFNPTYLSYGSQAIGLAGRNIVGF